MDESANRRTGEPANRRPGHPANRRTGKSANQRTGEPANRRHFASHRRHADSPSRRFGNSSTHRFPVSPTPRFADSTPPPSDVIYGRRPVLEALKAQTRSLHKIWIADGTHGTEEIHQMARERGVPVERAHRRDLDHRAGGGHHQGIVAQASAAGYLELEDFLQKVKDAQDVVVIALDEIQDPHNIGAILRSAAYFGVRGAIVPRWRSGPVGETAARVSSGGIEHVPLIRVRNLAEAVLALQEAGFEVIGADMGGSPLEDYVPGRKTAIIFGSEGSGLRRLVRERCDKLLKVLGSGKVSSLNVSAAAAIFLHHFSRKA